MKAGGERGEEEDVPPDGRPRLGPAAGLVAAEWVSVRREASLGAMRCRERGREEWVREERSEASGATGFSSPFVPSSIFGAGSRNVSRNIL